MNGRKFDGKKIIAKYYEEEHKINASSILQTEVLFQSAPKIISKEVKEEQLLDDFFSSLPGKKVI